MKKYLLPENGRFYKANLHCHSTCSDGRKTPEQLKELYRSLGYSILALTDHNVFVPHPELNDENFLALHGTELEVIEPVDDPDFNYKKACHLCMIALDPSIPALPKFERWEYTGECLSEVMQTARDNGFFVTYNHPCWSRENYEQYTAYRGMHAMEMFNGGALTTGYTDYNPRVYDDILRSGNRIYCIGADDNHNVCSDTASRKSDSGVAFTFIKADSLDYPSISDALLKGNFYASQGPRIEELWYEDGRVYVRCSEADRINSNRQYRCDATVMAEQGQSLTEASFKINPDYGYFRITVTDARGRTACTNAYFPDSL